MTEEILELSEIKSEIVTNRTATIHSLELLLDVAANLIHDEDLRLRITANIKEILSECQAQKSIKK